MNRTIVVHRDSRDLTTRVITALDAEDGLLAARDEAVDAARRAEGAAPFPDRAAAESSHVPAVVTIINVDGLQYRRDPGATDLVTADGATWAQIDRKNTLDATRAPLPTDDVSQGYAPGSRWLWQGQEWVAVGVDAGAARWVSTLQVTPQVFGAVGDGVADDTAAVQAALSVGSILLRGGPYRVTDTLTISNQDRTLTGSGGLDIIFDPPTPRPLLSISRSGTTGGLRVQGAWFSTRRAGATAVRAEETRPGGGPHVVGAHDLVTLDGCRFAAEGTGYWRHAAHMVNAGGLVVRGTTAANFQNFTAQADADTAAFRFDVSAGFAVIRALHWTQSYTQRFHSAIRLAVAGSLESVYLGQGEMVGHFYGLRAEGAGNIGAVSIAGTHMDCITANVWSDCTGGLNIVRITGADLRLGRNGAAADPNGENIHVHSGNYGLIMGGFLDAYLTSQKGVVIEANYPSLTVSGVCFRRQAVAVTAPNLTRGEFSSNTFENVATRYNLPALDGVSVSGADHLTGSVTYTGDLSALADARSGMKLTRLGANFTNGPPGISGAGHICTTMIWDVNAATQQFYSRTKALSYIRRKSAGAWGAWFRITSLAGTQDSTGAGSPEGVVAAPVGSTYRRTDGGAGTTLYVKESGSGSTGWVAK